MKKQLAASLFLGFSSLTAFAQECKTEVETVTTNYYGGLASCHVYMNSTFQRVEQYIHLTTQPRTFIGEWITNPSTNRRDYATCFANVPFSHSDTKTTNIKYCKDKVLIEARGGSPEQAQSFLRQRGATEIGGCRPDFYDQPMSFICVGYIIDWVKQ
ncbi:hypothetical protein [Pseudoalteromonas luteoviolacea]|uniref:Uncharacterized protein n=1 Tax=Pseudoalteromonas luteoviolacea S4054 TaxID=1129367 RepID=A0A0F6A7L5_9GAMM|nr:hypothetical protein [Pseudoalteromonas luteoviolacea]AOT07641.1 hypothetical protein S4054249_07205 [Pseudoalteromonas luteoviolacea]AOT12557.1 hypothetical protein S40542_07205 [Pseudoalteromonas luteoviolacea]AOT17471.1 hypothetical protein S4054_07205 [Pseudoalteromonas luteoviolacea]KKE81384.1 hypothetical protein N479_22890 [Pseudoalteromonas luteoviolacea S4054]KZN70607.1 hypothetical protein N481_20540 [Pseudoalteromonas luteoviolacea S4047-1]